MIKRLLAALLVVLLLPVAVGGQITVPYVFSPNTRALSAEVNANFAKFADALNRTGGTMTGTLNVQTLLPTADNTYDLGSAAFSFRDFHLERNALVGGTLGVTGITSLNVLLVSSTSAGAIDVEGGITAGSGNVALVGTDGKINGPLSSTIIDNLSGANLTGILETNIADGAVLARLAANETVSGQWTFSAVVTAVAANVSVNTGFSVRDTGNDHYLTIAPGTNLTANRTLSLVTGDATRTITLSGNPTLADWFDQSVKVAASPVFAALGIGVAATEKLTVRSGDDLTATDIAIFKSNNQTAGTAIGWEGIRRYSTGANGRYLVDAKGTGSLLLQSVSTGTVGIGTTAPLAKLAINGGLHVGGDSDPGDNNALIDGTLTTTGLGTFSAGLRVTGSTAGTGTVRFLANALVLQSGTNGFAVVNSAASANLGLVTDAGGWTFGDDSADAHTINGIISTTGRINSASAQPGFLAVNSTTDSVGLGEPTIDFDSEVYDEASNFSADTFTAPVTGRYLLCVTISISGAGSGGTAEGFINTSNREYVLEKFSYASGVISGTSTCVIADMDSSDTATVSIQLSSAADIHGNASATVHRTFFSGRLMP